MLYDRPYMRGGVPGRREIPYLYWVLGTTVAGFIVQSMIKVWVNPTFMSSWFALGMEQIMSGRVWTLLTYSMLHGGIFHILVNGFIIFFAWRALEPLIGAKRVLQVYLAAVLLGGMVYLGVHFRGGTVEGASAGALGLLMLFCLMQPDRPITLLLFFIIPVTLRPRWIIWILLGIDGVGFLFTELPLVFGRTPLAPSPVAYSAHLGGMLAGWLFFRFVLNSGFNPLGMPGRKIAIEPPEWLKRKPRTAKTSRGFKLNMSDRTELKKEVDRILDKINTKGFGALSDEEKRTLDRARDILKN